MKEIQNDLEKHFYQEYEQLKQYYDSKLETELQSYKVKQR